jgi:hypothetical protein
VYYSINFSLALLITRAMFTLRSGECEVGRVRGGEGAEGWLRKLAIAAEVVADGREQVARGPTRTRRVQSTN